MVSYGRLSRGLCFLRSRFACGFVGNRDQYIITFDVFGKLQSIIARARLCVCWYVCGRIIFPSFRSTCHANKWRNWTVPYICLVFQPLPSPSASASINPRFLLCRTHEPYRTRARGGSPFVFEKTFRRNNATVRFPPSHGEANERFRRGSPPYPPTPYPHR